MNSPSPSQAWFEFYEGPFLRDVHQLLAWGYEDVKDRLTLDSQEEEITGWIVDAIKDRLDLMMESRFQHYDVCDSPPVRHSRQTGKRRKKLDIMLNTTSVRPAPEFHCEAKRLRRPGYPISNYVGPDGLGCFLRGEYAAEHPTGAMLGYVQSDGPDHWINELKRRLDKDSDGALRCTEDLARHSVVADLPHELTSRHSREELDDIRIHHIFLYNQ